MKTCSSCRETKPFKDFYFNKKYRTYFTKCKKCILAQPNYRDSWLRNRYGITEHEYNNLLATQDGVCAICKREEKDKRLKYLSVAHCHKTGRVRGLLCNSCNVGLSRFEDNILYLKNAINFLDGKFGG